jgi:hypothetical protein
MYSLDVDDWPAPGADDNDDVALGRGATLIQRRVLLRKLTREFDAATNSFAKPGGTLLFPDAPAGVWLAWSNRDPDDYGSSPVKFAFAQQRATPGLHDGDPPDADPVAGFTGPELVEAGWDRTGQYAPGKYSRGGHAHRCAQTELLPVMTNRPESTWLEEGNPPEHHLLRLEHDGWQEPVDIGGRIYGTRALSWWPDILWADTGERVPQGTHSMNHYYRAPDDWVGPMRVYPEGLTMQHMASQASLDSMVGGGWYVGQDRWRMSFGDHKVSGDKVYELTQTLNFPELMSLDRDVTDPDVTVHLCRRSDGYRGILDGDGDPWMGKSWSDTNETAGPDPALGRDGERWVVVPALRVFLELAVPDGGWIPSAASEGIPSGWKTSEYYGRHFRFSTAGLTGWPDQPSHQHGEYLASFALGHHFPQLPGLPDWFDCLDAVARWSQNERWTDPDVLWWRGCETVHLEFDPGVLAAVPHTPWPVPAESWDGHPLTPMVSSKARITVTATNADGSGTMQTMLDMKAD